MEDRLDAIFRVLEDSLVGGRVPPIPACKKELEQCMADMRELMIEPMHTDKAWVEGLSGIREQLNLLAQLLDRFMDNGVGCHRRRQLPYHARPIYVTAVDSMKVSVRAAASECFLLYSLRCTNSAFLSSRACFASAARHLCLVAPPHLRFLLALPFLSLPARSPCRPCLGRSWSSAMPMSRTSLSAEAQVDEWFPGRALCATNGLKVHRGSDGGPHHQPRE